MMIPGGLPACPRCGGAQTGSAWGRAICPRCHGEAIRRADGAAAARARHRATLARIATASPEPGVTVPLPPHVVVVARTDADGSRPEASAALPMRRLPVCWPAGVPTLRERLRARRAAERGPYSP